MCMFNSLVLVICTFVCQYACTHVNKHVPIQNKQARKHTHALHAQVQLRGFEVHFEEHVGLSDDALPILVSYVEMNE